MLLLFFLPWTWLGGPPVNLEPPLVWRGDTLWQQPPQTNVQSTIELGLAMAQRDPAPAVSVISRYKLFEICPILYLSDITSVSVHLDVDRSVNQPTQWTLPSAL